jgi:hypothetical protein
MSRSLIGFYVVLALLTGGVTRPAFCDDSSGSVTPSAITPKGDLPLRSWPPGFFSAKGDLIGTISPGRDYRVLEQREVHTLGGSESWLKVTPASGDGAEGWVYAGPAENPLANVDPASR